MRSDQKTYYQHHILELENWNMTHYLSPMNVGIVTLQVESRVWLLYTEVKVKVLNPGQIFGKAETGQ